MYPLSSSLATETRQRCWGTQAKQNISMKAFHFNCLNSFMPKMIPWDSNMCLQGDESRPLQPVVGREQRSDYKGLPWLPREPRGPSEPGRASQVGKVCLCNTPATWNNFTLLFSKPQQIAFKNVEGKKKCWTLLTCPNCSGVVPLTLWLKSHLLNVLPTKVHLPTYVTTDIGKEGQMRL